MVWPLIDLSSFVYLFMDRKIIVWNCRGTGSASFCRSAGLLVSDSRPDVMVLLETRVDMSRA